jgi:hypothetical protein
MTPQGYICGPSIYKFEKWLFEVHSYFGPWPIKECGEPYKRAGKVFFDMWDRFKELPEAEQKNHMWHQGGCRPL